jgi:uncharacterized protein YdiU (UPF0061 family)
MKEQELVSKLDEAEDELKLAQRALAEAKKRWTDAETLVIDCKIHRDRMKNKLRDFRAVTPKYEPTKRDEDIEQYRKNNPEVVEMARQRDLNRGNE